MTTSPYGGRPPYVKGSDTSRQASDSIAKPRGRLQHQVFEAIRSSPSGLTCDEVEEQLDMRHQTASARIRELVQAGHLVDSGERRKTRSGRQATVWRPPKPGQQELF